MQNIIEKLKDLYVLLIATLQEVGEEIQEFSRTNQPRPLNEFGGWLTVIAVFCWVGLLQSAFMAPIALLAVFSAKAKLAMFGTAVAYGLCAFSFYKIIYSFTEPTEDTPKVVNMYLVIAFVATIIRKVVPEVSVFGIVFTVVLYYALLKYFETSERVRSFFGATSKR